MDYVYVCAKKKRPCVSCLLGKSNNSQNLLSCRQKNCSKTMCSKSMSCQSSTLSPSSYLELNDSLGSDHTAPTIKKTLKFFTLFWGIQWRWVT